MPMRMMTARPTPRASSRIIPELVPKPEQVLNGVNPKNGKMFLLDDSGEKVLYASWNGSQWIPE